jgi:hypothetical protein
MSRQSNAFRLQRGKVNLTSGVRSYNDETQIYLCAVNGSLKLTYHDNATETVTCAAGMAFTMKPSRNSAVLGVKSVEIVSGTFHIGN